MASKERGGSRKAALDALLAEAEACAFCPRMSGKAATRFAGRRVHRPVMFVAEAPGRHGAGRTGIPLFGDATGRNFEALLAAAGWGRSEVWVTNAVMCWPGDAAGNNRRPARGEMEACSRFLAGQIDLIAPRVVVPLGRVALEALNFIAPIQAGALRDLVGHPQPWNDRLVVPLYHPSPRVANTSRSLQTQKRDFRALARLCRSLG